MDVGELGCFDNLRVGGFGAGKADVFHYAAVKEARLLRDKRDVLMQRILRDFGNVLVGNEDFPFIEVIGAQDEVDKG